MKKTLTFDPLPGVVLYLFLLVVYCEGMNIVLLTRHETCKIVCSVIASSV